MTAGRVRVHRNPAALTGVGFPGHLEAHLPATVCRRARDTITRWPGYAPTPLRQLPELAGELGVGRLSYKDESGRFGQGSFKALGGAYGVFRAVVAHVGRMRGTAPEDPGSVGEPSLEAQQADVEAEVGSGRAVEAASLTVATASDGNHGRAVAWGASRFGCRCVVYLHASVSRHRSEAIAALGGEVVRVPGGYDDAVRRCATDARANGWELVADTSDDPDAPGPREVMAGYTTLVTEVLDVLGRDRPPSHVVVPGGVGGLAAAVIAETWRALGPDRPDVVVVEPSLAACLTVSARSGVPTPVTIHRETVMAGLSCGEVSAPAWPIVHAGTSAFVTLDDATVPAAMRRLAQGSAGGVVAGESGAAGVAMLLAAVDDPGAWRCLGLGPDAHVLVLGTEGATDPEIYRELTG